MSKIIEYLKGFIAGKKGHSHSVQEFIAWFLLVGIIGWFVSIILAAVMIVLLSFGADIYWIKREQRQSINMGRIPYDEVFEFPEQPNSFWTQDARDDVNHPRKFRKVWIVLSVIYVLWLAYKIY